MKHEGAFSRIISVIKNVKVAIRENLFYDSVKTLIDFADDDLINLRAAKSLISGGDDIKTPIVGGTTANPITIEYGSLTDPTIICRNTDGTEYSGTQKTLDNAYAGSPDNSITFTGDDNGSGKFLDTFYIILKP